MSINLASRLSSITTDFAGTTHLVWSEGSAIWHAVYDTNSATWINAQAIADIGLEPVTSLNLVAADNLIAQSGSANNTNLPGLAVVWQQGNLNSSDFYYSAAQYNDNNQLQWLASPMALTSDQVADLKPRVIVNNSGEVLVVGQKVNVEQAENQSIQEDTDLYYQSFTVNSDQFVSLPTGTTSASYTAPIIKDGIIQGNLNTGSINAQPAPLAAYSVITPAEAMSFAATSNSSPAFQGWGQNWNFSQAWSSNNLENWGILDGIPFPGVKGLLSPFFNKIKIEGILQGSDGFDVGSLLNDKSGGLLLNVEGEVVTRTKKIANLFKISGALGTIYDFDNSPPNYLLNTETTVLELTFNAKFPFYDLGTKRVGFEADAIGSFGVLLQAVVSPNSSSYVPPLTAGLKPDGELEAWIVVPPLGSAAAIAVALGTPIAEIIGGANDQLSLDSFQLGFPVSAGVQGQLTLTSLFQLTGNGQISLIVTLGDPAIGFTLGFPITLSAKLLSFINISMGVNPSWTWQTNPYGALASTATTNNFALASFSATNSTDSTEPTATVQGSLLTLDFSSLGTTLNTGIIPSPSDFTVTYTNGAGQSENVEVFGVIVQENGVVLRLSSPILYTQLNDQAVTNPVQVTYTPSSTVAANLQDSQGNAIAGFTDLSVTNNSTQSLTYSYNPVSGDGQNYTNTLNQIIINFNTPLNTEIIPTASQFSVSSNDNNIVVDSVVAITNNSVTLQLASNAGKNYTVTYTPGSSQLTNLQDSSNNQIPTFTVISGTSSTTQTVNSTSANSISTSNLIADLETDFAQDSPPTLALTTSGDILIAWSSDTPPVTPISAVTDGNKIYLTFADGLNNQTDQLPINNQFTVTVNGNQTIATVSNISLDENTLTLNLSDAITASDIVEIAYSLSANSGNYNNNLNLTDATNTLLWVPTFSSNVTFTGDSTVAPSPLEAVGLSNLLTLTFDQVLKTENIPNGSQFVVSVNNNIVTVNSVNVGQTSISLTLAQPIGQGDVISVSYTTVSNQSNNLANNNSIQVDDFTANNVITTFSNPSTVIKTAFSPFGNSGISAIGSIPGTTGLNFDAVATFDSNTNSNMLVWVNANTNDIPNQLIPGQIYTDDQVTLINNSFKATDIYYSVLGSNNQWSLAAPITAQQPGTDAQVALGQGPNGQLMAAWINTQDNNGELTTTINYSSWDGTTWITPQIILSEITPDPSTELSISSLNGNPAIFWTETQPTSYSELVLESDPVIYLRLGELSGTTARNDGLLLGAGNGTYSGTYTLAEEGALENPNSTSLKNLGDPNPATLFDGGQVTVDDLPVIGQDFSVEFWFKGLADDYDNLNLVSFTSLFQVVLSASTADSVQVNFNLENGSSLVASGLANNTWNYVVGTYNGQSQTMSLYVNGQLAGSLGNVIVTNPPTSGTLTLAGSTGAVYLDEVALYNSVLTYDINSSSDLTPSNVTASQLIDFLGDSNQIGDRYGAQYVDPLPPGPETYHSVWNGNTWQSPNKIEPTPTIVPTQLADANAPTWDIVADTAASANGNINPNGVPDIYLPLTLTNQQAQTITSIELTANYNGQTLAWAIGTAATSSTNQLGVVQGNTLLNSLNSDGSSFSYSTFSPTVQLGLYVDSSFLANNSDIPSPSNWQVSINGEDAIAVQAENLTSKGMVTSEPFNSGSAQVLGIATVTEVNDSSLALIDSGFIINTNNSAIANVLTSGFDGAGNLSYVAVGNRGYTNSSGTPLNGGTIQILFAGGDVLLNSENNPLTTTNLSGNPNGILITGITDQGTANNNVSMSLATGDIDGDGIPDLVIGDGNANGENGAIYVIFGSYLTTNPGATIDVTSLNTNPSSMGFVFNGLDTDGLAGFSVVVGNFNGDSYADIAFGSPQANDGAGKVYVIYGSSTTTISTASNAPTATLIYTGQTEEAAGYALGVSHYSSGGPTTFTGSDSNDDLIIGAPGHQVAVTNQWSGQSGLPQENQSLFPSTTTVSAGAIYVFNGGSSGINSSPSYTLIGPSSPALNGLAADSFAGAAIASGDFTDLDGDGQQDLAISALGMNTNTGTVYVVKGGSLTSSSPQNLTSVSNLVINGGIPSSKTGFSISSPGDINDDGYQDFLINAPQAANATGQSYLLFGPLNLDDLGTIFDLSPTATDSKTTFLLNGNQPFQATGQAAVGIGDINNDGVDDLMVTAPGANQLYAVYGHPWLMDDGSIKLADISGDNGFVIDGDLYSATVGTQIYNLGDESSAAPAFINNNGTFYLAYVENGGNQIYLTTSSDAGQTWTSAVELPSGITTSQSPSLAFYQGTLYLAYVGTNEQINITSSTDNGQSWSSQYKIDQFSSAGVSLVVYQDQLMAFFVGTESSSDILYVYSDNPQSGASWSTDYTVANPGGGTSSPNQTASQAVSATVMGETLYLAYQGGTVGSGNNYYVTNTSGSTLTNLTWSVSELSGATNSNTAPGITNDGSQLYFTYSNSSSDLYYLTSSNGTSWSGLNEINDQTSNDLPAPAILGGRLYLGYTGTDSDADVSVTALSGSQILLGAGNDVVMLGDINGDGFADVLAGGSINGAVVTFGASTQDLLDAAAGTDELIINIADGGLMQSVEAAGDFNGDGLADFGVVDQNNNFYLILGNANLGPQQTLTLSTSANINQTGITSAVAVGDYNGDGYDDLLLSSSNGGQTLYKGNSSGALNSSVTFGANSNTVFNGIGDVNGDGFGDIGGGEPNGNVISPNATGNGQATVYLGNISAGSASSNSTNITPPSAAISGTLDNSDWSFNGLSEAPNTSPSFAVFNGYLYMVYNTKVTEITNSTTGATTTTTTNFYIQRSADGYNWEGLTSLGSNFESDTQASLAVFNNTLYLAFTATNNLVIVTPATTDSSSDLGLTFDSTNSINAGSNTAPTGIGPTLAVYDGDLYLFFAANNTTQTILYTTSSDGSTWSSTAKVTDSSGNAQETGSRLGVAVDGDNLLVSFIGNGNEDVNVATYNGTSWNSNEVSGQSSSSGPNLLSVGDTLYLFFTSSNKNDEILYLTSTDGGSTWSSALTNIPNQTTNDRPSPVLFQESILVGYETTGTPAIGIATSNPIYEPNQTQQFGQQLQNIGDFNGDGIADLAVMASGFRSNLGSLNNNLLENNQGAVLIYYGTTSGITNTASPDVVLAAPPPNASTSTANNQAILLSNFSGAGDINSDGYDDLLIASPNTALDSSDTTDGSVLVVFGGSNSFWQTGQTNNANATNSFNLGSLSPLVSTLTLQFDQSLNTASIPATNLFSVTNGFSAAGSIFVTKVVVNDNNVILTLNTTINTTENISIIYSQPTSGGLENLSGNQITGFTASNTSQLSTSDAPLIDFTGVDQSQYGFTIAGLPNSQAGISLSGGGDVNGDGFSDFIIGAPGNNDNLTYTLFGSDFTNTVNQTGTIGDDVMLGTPTGESFVAGQGDDFIETNGGLDVVYAAEGNDWVTVSDTYFQRLDGGTGTDVLQLTGYNGQDWDLTTLSPGLRLRDFEILDSRNYGANTITLNALTVTQLSSNNTLTVLLDEADSLNLSSDFSAAGKVYQYNQNFYQYTSNVSAAKILVNQANSPTFTADVTNSPAPILPSDFNTVTNTFLDNSQQVAVTTNESFVVSQPNAPTQLFVSNPTVSELEGVANFTIQRTGDLGKAVLVSYITQDVDGKAGDRYLPVVGQLIFAPNESSKTVAVQIPNNSRFVGDRQFGLAVSLLTEKINIQELPSAFNVEINPNGEQIRRLSSDTLPILDQTNGESIQYDVTANNGSVTLDLAVTVTPPFNQPLFWNASAQEYQALPLVGANSLKPIGDINSDSGTTLYQVVLQEGGAFDTDGVNNGLIGINLNLPLVNIIETPDNSSVVQGTVQNDYISAAGRAGTYRLEGLAGDDMLIGSEQRDILTGGEGRDQLFGRGGVDKLFGDGGDDFLDGGNGLDFLYGGSGADAFVLRSGDGTDRIMDFNPTEGDLLVLDKISFGSLNFNGNQILLGSEILAIAIDASRQPVTDFVNNPQWFVSI